MSLLDALFQGRQRWWEEVLKSWVCYQQQSSTGQCSCLTYILRDAAAWCHCPWSSAAYRWAAIWALCCSDRGRDSQRHRTTPPPRPAITLKPLGSVSATHYLLSVWSVDSGLIFTVISADSPERTIGARMTTTRRGNWCITWISTADTKEPSQGNSSAGPSSSPGSRPDCSLSENAHLRWRLALWRRATCHL